MGQGESCSCEARGCHPFAGPASGTGTTKPFVQLDPHDADAPKDHLLPALNLHETSNGEANSPRTNALPQTDRGFMEMEVDAPVGEVVLESTDVTTMCPGFAQSGLPKAVEAQEASAVSEVPKTTTTLPKFREVHVLIQKSTDDRDVGLDVDYAHSDHLKVVRVKPGLIKDWSDLHPNLEVRCRDLIISVNDVTRTEDMLSEIRRSDTLRFLCRRHNEFEMIIEKEDSKQAVGLDVDWTIMKVVKVKEGPIMDYNKGLENTGSSEFELRPGDMIVEINDVRGAQGVLEELKNSMTLRMLVTRPYVSP